MLEKEYELEIDTCMEPAPAPRQVTVNGPDGSVVFLAQLQELPFHRYQQMWREVDKLGDQIEANAVMICAHVTEWSADVPVTPAGLYQLHPAIQALLMRETRDIGEVKAAQVKNSMPHLTSPDTQPNGEKAA